MPFLGKEANVPAGMAVFAYQANVPIIFGFITRLGWSRHQLRIFDPIWPDRTKPKQDEWLRLTLEVFSRIETAIREQPEQWFWYNKRWILRSPGAGNRESEVGSQRLALKRACTASGSVVRDQGGDGVAW